MIVVVGTRLPFSLVEVICFKISTVAIRVPSRVHVEFVSIVLGTTMACKIAIFQVSAADELLLG